MTRRVRIARVYTIDRPNRPPRHATAHRGLGTADSVGPITTVHSRLHHGGTQDEPMTSAPRGDRAYGHHRPSERHATAPAGARRSSSGTDHCPPTWRAWSTERTGSGVCRVGGPTPAAGALASQQPRAGPARPDAHRHSARQRRPARPAQPIAVLHHPRSPGHRHPRRPRSPRYAPLAAQLRAGRPVPDRPRCEPVRRRGAGVVLGSSLPLGPFPAI